MFVVLAVTGALVLGGCGSKGVSQNNSSISTPTPKANMDNVQTQSPAVTGTSVSIQNFSFSPATLTVKKGATVTWTNNDSAVHTIKSSSFTSGDLSKGDTFQFTFNTPGTFDYACGIHPSMQGKIVVEELRLL